MRNRVLAIATVLGLCAFAGIGGASLLAAPDTALPWSVFGTGGGAATSTNYHAGATLGQAGPIGPASSANFHLGAGFWYGGCPDFDADVACDAQDAEDDGDGFTDLVESGAPLCTGSVNNDGPPPPTNPMSDDTVVNDGCPAVTAAEADCTNALDDDGDGMVNDGCPQVGSFSEGQFKVGTGSIDSCGNNGWPLDLVSTGLSANRYNVSDLGSFVSGLKKLGKNPNQTGFDSRWDLVPGPITGALGLGWINVQDLATTTGGATAFPRMLGGVRAANQLCPYPP